LRRLARLVAGAGAARPRARYAPLRPARPAVRL